ncbi:hypothetical protein AMECASPLE_024706 [Ameca splendens]|uniref:Uncharacterized protein n=1 Tax=Ameca splendens TaxID=208324 RepID=A0ABV0XHD7_9TELE
MKIPDTQTVFHSYLTLHMIDDRMTSLDPVEEFMFACHQRDISALVSPIRSLSKAVWKRADAATAVLLFGQWRHRKSAVIPFPGCAGRRLMHFILKSSRTGV